jgi:hypothetical protein
MRAARSTRRSTAAGKACSRDLTAQPAKQARSTGRFSPAVLCWARALGEFGATITFAGNFPGRTQTMPLAVYSRWRPAPGQEVWAAVKAAESRPYPAGA